MKKKQKTKALYIDVENIHLLYGAEECFAWCVRPESDPQHCSELGFFCAAMVQFPNTDVWEAEKVLQTSSSFSWIG